jgi:hypothetical protein
MAIDNQNDFIARMRWLLDRTPSRATEQRRVIAQVIATTERPEAA